MTHILPKAHELVKSATPKIPGVDDQGEGFLGFATYEALPCGCHVTGNGTLPHPLTVKQCPLHAVAPDLLQELKHLVQSVCESDPTQLWAVLNAVRVVLKFNHPNATHNLRDLLPRIEEALERGEYVAGDVILAEPKAEPPPTVQARDYRSALHLINLIGTGNLPLPVKVQCGHACFTITKENQDAVSLGVLMAAEWPEWEPSAEETL